MSISRYIIIDVTTLIKKHLKTYNIIIYIFLIYRLFKLILCFHSTVQCNSFPNIPGQAISMDSNNTATSATFTCEAGYSLIGVTLLTCLSNGSWSGNQPHCGKQRIKQSLHLRGDVIYK